MNSITQMMILHHLMEPVAVQYLPKVPKVKTVRDRRYFNKRRYTPQGVNNRLRKFHKIKQPGYDVQRKR